MVAGYYVGALFTPGIKNTIYTMMDKYKVIKAAPFAMYFSKYTVAAMLFSFAVYFVFAIFILFGEKTYRNGEEAGSSKWESPQRITKLLSDKSTDRKDPLNLVVYKPKKTFFLIRFFKDIYFRIKTRKAN